MVLGTKTDKNLHIVLDVNTARCAKCGGNLYTEPKEKRIVCLNCGAAKYYGIPLEPARGASPFWALFALEPNHKYKPTQPGAVIYLGHGTSHFRDTGCKRSPRCQDCPLLVCPEVID